MWKRIIMAGLIGAGGGWQSAAEEVVHTDKVSQTAQSTTEMTDRIKLMAERLKCLETKTDAYCWKERCEWNFCMKMNSGNAPACSPQMDILTRCNRKVAQAIKEKVCPPNMKKKWVNSRQIVVCSCEAPYVEEPKSGKCVTVEEYMNAQPDCPGHETKTWDAKERKSVCVCKSPFFTDPLSNKCVSVEEALAARPDCPENMTKTWNAGEMKQECHCYAPYVTDPRSGKCLTQMEILRNIPKCDSGKVALWSEENKKYECKCPANAPWWQAAGRCMTVTEQRDYCYNRFQAILVGSGSDAYCDCAKGYTMDVEKRYCVPLKNEQPAVSENELCQKVSRTTLVNGICTCISPFVWNAPRTACICPFPLVPDKTGSRCIRKKERALEEMHYCDSVPGSVPRIMPDGTVVCECPPEKPMRSFMQRCASDAEVSQYCQSRYSGSIADSSSPTGCSCGNDALLIGGSCIPLIQICDRQLPGSVPVRSGGEIFCQCPRSKGLMLDRSSNRCINSRSYCQASLPGSRPVWRGESVTCECPPTHYRSRKYHRCIRRKRKHTTRSRHTRHRTEHSTRQNTSQHSTRPQPNPALYILPMMNLINQSHRSRHHHYHQHY